MFRLVLCEKDLEEYVRRPAPVKDSKEELEADKTSKGLRPSEYRTSKGSYNAAVAALGEDVSAAL